MKESLSELERFTTFPETDGYLRLTFTDCGRVEMFCGKEVSVPGDFTPECPHDPAVEEWGKSPERDRELMAQAEGCDCPDTGWLAEIRAAGIAQGSSWPLTHGSHVYAFGLTMQEAIDALHAKVLAGEVCCDWEKPFIPPRPSSTEKP